MRSATLALNCSRPRVISGLGAGRWALGAGRWALGAGRWARKTEFEVLNNGAVRRRIERADGTVEKEEGLTGPRWELRAARAHSGLSQTEFARALGVSKRTLENWEQGRAQLTGAARQLLRLAAQFPDTVSRLATIGH
jgi:putative transcriptional regulator